MGKWRRLGIFVAVWLVLIAGLLVYRGLSHRPMINAVWSTVIPGAGGSQPVFTDCQAYRGEALVSGGLWTKPQMIGFDGVIRWEFDPSSVPDPVADDEVMQVNVGDDGWLYLGTRKNNIYAFDDRQIFQWRTRLNGYREWSAMSTVAADRTVYAFSPGYLSAIDHRGNILWEVNVDGIKGISPPVLDAPDRLYGRTSNLELVAINTAGRELWRSGHVTVGLDEIKVASDGTVLCSNKVRGFINAFQPDGNLRWNRIVAPSAVVLGGDWWMTLGPDDTVYIAESPPAGKPSLTALSIDGNLKWKREFRFDVTNPAVLPDGRIIVTECPSLQSAGLLQSLAFRLNSLTRSINPRINILDSQGNVITVRVLEYAFTVLPHMFSAKGELLLIDHNGVMHAYEL